MGVWDGVEEGRGRAVPRKAARRISSTPRSPSSTTARFGACPRPVFERYQAWQRELEREPVDFLDRRLPDLLDAARAALADYVGCSARDLAFVQNATTGVNLAARSLPLGPDDEVLATDLEYGACELAWEWERDWDGVRERCRRLAREARRELCELLETEPLAPDSMVAQMATVRLPHPAPELAARLFTRHRVEIPVGGTEQDPLRLSVAAYTTCEEIDRLLAALARELDTEHRQQNE